MDYTGRREVGVLVYECEGGSGKRCVIFIRDAERQLPAILLPYTSGGKRAERGCLMRKSKRER